MRLKLIIALVNDDKTEAVIDAARGRRGHRRHHRQQRSGRGPGGRKGPFFGLGLEHKRAIILFLVVEQRGPLNPGSHRRSRPL